MTGRAPAAIPWPSTEGYANANVGTWTPKPGRYSPRARAYLKWHANEVGPFEPTWASIDEYASARGRRDLDQDALARELNDLNPDEDYPLFDFGIEGTPEEVANSRSDAFWDGLAREFPPLGGQQAVEDAKRRSREGGRMAYYDDDYEPGGTSDDFYAPAPGSPQDEYVNPVTSRGWTDRSSEDGLEEIYTRGDAMVTGVGDGEAEERAYLLYPPGSRDPVMRRFETPEEAMDFAQERLRADEEVRGGQGELPLPGLSYQQAGRRGRVAGKHDQLVSELYDRWQSNPEAGLLGMSGYGKYDFYGDTMHVPVSTISQITGIKPEVVKDRRRYLRQLERDDQRRTGRRRTAAGNCADCGMPMEDYTEFPGPDGPRCMNCYEKDPEVGYMTRNMDADTLSRMWGGGPKRRRGRGAGRHNSPYDNVMDGNWADHDARPELAEGDPEYREDKHRYVVWGEGKGKPAGDHQLEGFTGKGGRPATNPYTGGGSGEFDGGPQGPHWVKPKRSSGRVGTVSGGAYRSNERRKESAMSLAARGRVASKGRRQHFADESRNDQGVQEPAFISQTPAAEAVEAPTGDESKITNTESNLVARVQRGTAQLQRDAAALARLRRMQRRAEATESADKVDPSLSGTDDQSLKGDLEALQPAQVATQPKDASLKVFKAFDSWLRRTSGRSARELHSKALTRQAARFCKATGTPPKAMYPAMGYALREARKVEANTRGAAVNRRRVAVDLPAAAPDARVDVEAPVKNTTDDAAQAAQYPLSDYGQNAGDSVANPDLSTDSQIWAPGEKTSRKADGVMAVRCAEAYIKAGLEPEESRWRLAALFQTMNRGFVQRDIALLERVAAMRAEEAARTARRTPGSSRGATKGFPPGFGGAPRRTAGVERVASNDPVNDAALWI